MKLRLTYLYPAEMNIYGDRGNIITLQQRCRWRGIDTVVDEVKLGDKYDFGRADIIFGGGGQDRGQELVATDLQQRSQALHQAAKAGVPMLVVCGLYQLFGRRFTTSAGTNLGGIGIFAAETMAGPDRMIGNMVIASRFGQLVGFENHSGQTKLDANQGALGKIKTGNGNDGLSGYEGAISHNAIGTYLHGPVLPKNPTLADFLITTALNRRGYKGILKPLDDTLEHQAAERAAKLQS